MVISNSVLKAKTGYVTIFLKKEGIISFDCIAYP